MSSSRDAELEALRANSIVGKQRSQLNTASLPSMTMDSWYETQRNATKEEQRKKLEATSQLHNYRGRDIPGAKKREPQVSPKFGNGSLAHLPPGPDAQQEDVRGKDIKGIVTSLETTKNLPSPKNDNHDAGGGFEGSKTHNNHRPKDFNSTGEVGGEAAISVAEEIKRYSNKPARNEENTISASPPSKSAEVKRAPDEEAVKDLTTDDKDEVVDKPSQTEETPATGDSIPEATLEPIVNEVQTSDALESDKTSPAAFVESEVSDNTDSDPPMKEEDTSIEIPSKSSGVDLGSSAAASPVAVDEVPQEKEKLANVSPSAEGISSEHAPQNVEEAPPAATEKETESQPVVPTADEGLVPLAPTPDEVTASIVPPLEEEPISIAAVPSTEEKNTPIVTQIEKEPVVTKSPPVESAAPVTPDAAKKQQPMKKIDVKVLLAVHVKQSDGEAVMKGRGKSILDSIIGVTERIVKETLEENRESPLAGNDAGKQYAFQQAVYKDEHRPYIETVNIDSGFANAPKGIVRLVVREVVCIFEPKSVTKKDAGEVIGVVAEALRHSVANGRFAKEAKALRKAMKQQQKLK